MRLGRTLLEVQRLLDQDRGRRLLGDERERTVLVDRDHDRNHRAGVALRLGVERLDELHDVDAVLTEGGSDRARRAALSANRLQLDLCKNLLGHSRLFLVQAKYTRAPSARINISPSAPTPAGTAPTAS